MTHLRPIDYFQIVTTMLFIALGTVAAVRSALAGVWMGCAVGAVMFAYGVWRTKAIMRALREVRR